LDNIAFYSNIPSQRLAGLPRNKSQSIRALAVSPCQAARLLSHWDAGRYQGSSYNVVDSMVPCCFLLGAFFAHQAMKAMCVNRRSAATGVGDTDAAAETQGDSNKDCVVSKSQTAAGDCQCQEPVPTVRCGSGVETCCLVRV